MPRAAECLCQQVVARLLKHVMLALFLAFSIQVPGGASAATPVRLTMDAASSTTPVVARGIDGNLRLAWTDTRAGGTEIFFTMLDAWGNRLLPDIQVSHSPAVSSTVPRIDVDAEGFAYICWLEYKTVWLAKLDQTGHTVDSTAVNLGFTYLAEYPDFDVTPSGNLGVGFTSQSGVLDEDYLVLFDASLNKLCQRRMFTNLTWLDRHVSVRCDDDLHCTMYWQSSDLFAGENLSGGAITPVCGNFGSGNICSGNNYSTMSNHAVGLVAQRGNRIYLGSGGGCLTAFSELPGPSVTPSARTLDAARSVVAWEDRRSGNADIYYAVYTNATRAKTGVDSLLAGGASSSTAPCVMSDQAGTVFAVWQDNRDGNSEIYFARTPEPAGYGTIQGTVLNAVTGQPMAFAQVHIVYPDHTGPLEYRNIFAGADGRYRLAGLSPSGLWALSASSEGFVSPQVSGIVAPAGQVVTVDLRVSTGSMLSGTIRDAFNGLPIGTAHVRVDSISGPVTRGMETGPDGRYRFDLYPGVYKVSISVPSLGLAGPFLSLANPYYWPDSALDVVVGPSPRSLAFELKTKTVLLVHGIRSEEAYWGTLLDEQGPPDTLRAALEREGWHTEALSYDWTRSIEEGGQAISRWLQPNVYRSSRVVAHSMGGLTSRWCAEQIAAPAGERPFVEIITLGTLHHGTPAATNGVRFVKAFVGWAAAKTAIPGIEQLTNLAVEAAIRKWIPFALDFEPGSERLNQLNYGPGHSGEDGERFCLPGSSEPTHAPEMLLPDVRYLAFAGDNPQDYAIWDRTLMNLCPSDGAVPVHSAKLYNTGPNVSSYLMSSLGTSEECKVRHEPQDARVASADLDAAAVIEFRNSACVRARVIEALSGAPIGSSAAALSPANVTAADTLLAALPTGEHLLGPGGTSADTIMVPAASKLLVFASWRQDGLALVLEDPAGAQIDSAACVGVAGRLFDSDPSSAWSRIEISAAASGRWILRATSVARSSQTVSLTPYVNGDVTLDAMISSAIASPGSPIRIMAALQRAASPLAGATVGAEIGSSSGAPVTIALVDNGSGGDVSSGDGIYSAFYVPGTTGTYAVRIRASGGAGPEYGGREALAAFRATLQVDIAIPEASVSASSAWVYTSDPLTHQFQIRNDGAIDADSVWVVARDESLGVALMDTVIAVPAQQSVWLVSRFSSTRVGLHWLSFRASALGGVADANVANSRVTRGVEVVAFGATPSIVSVPWSPAPPDANRQLAARAVPNPSRGSTLFEFSLARPAADVRILIVDLAGRRVALLPLGSLPAGVHRVPWRSPLPEGDWRSGIFFYRIQADALSATGRVVVVR